jgi:teichuronic acid biosynthesis glycosyltransferase TuaC
MNSATSPRILFVVPGDGQGSSMIFVRRQAQALCNEGVEIKLFYLRSRISFRRLISEFRRFRRDLARLRPTTVHAQFGTVTALFAALAAGRIPLIITYRGSDLNPPPETYRWQAALRARCGVLLSQLSALRAQTIVCVSHELRGRLWVRKDKVVVLPTGVDAGVFRPRSRQVARRRLGWTDQERVVLFNAGQDVFVKRLDLARNAAGQARRRVPTLRLEILDGTVAPHSIPDRMNGADCLLVTSVSEGSPTVVQEALACNLPIVSVAVGDVADRLRNVRNSTLAPSDPSVLAHALVQMIEPPRRSNGRLKAPDFCSRRIARRMKEIYTGLGRE